MAKVLSNALARSGAMVIPVRLSPSLSGADVIRALQTTNADKFLLLSLYEWKSDTYSGTEIIYEVEMEAIDKQGKVLARKKAQGIDQLGAAFCVKGQSPAGIWSSGSLRQPHNAQLTRFDFARGRSQL